MEFSFSSRPSLKMWPLDQYEHHLLTCYTCKFLVPPLDLLGQALWGWVPAISCLISPVCQAWELLLYSFYQELGLPLIENSVIFKLCSVEPWEFYGSALVLRGERTGHPDSLLPFWPRQLCFWPFNALAFHVNFPCRRVPCPKKFEDYY